MVVEPIDRSEGGALREGQPGAGGGGGVEAAEALAGGDVEGAVGGEGDAVGAPEAAGAGEDLEPGSEASRTWTAVWLNMWVT
jgi:hypothetical protein